jgi:hypothetical protein
MFSAQSPPRSLNMFHSVFSATLRSNQIFLFADRFVLPGGAKHLFILFIYFLLNQTNT